MRAVNLYSRHPDDVAWRKGAERRYWEETCWEPTERSPWSGVTTYTWAFELWCTEQAAGAAEESGK